MSRSLALVVMVVMVAVIAATTQQTTAGPREDREAVAALELAKARTTTLKAAAAASAVHPGECYTDLVKAEAAAKKSGKALVIWVGMACKDEPVICAELRTRCVMVHIAEYDGNRSPRLLVPGKDAYYSFAKAALDKGALGLKDVRETLAH